jgi:GTPase SAR1 family protein
LRYADRAKSIVMRAFVNETAGDKRIRELEEEVLRLRERIKMLLDAEVMRTTAAHTTASASSPPLSQAPVVSSDSQSLPPLRSADANNHSGASSHIDYGTTDLSGVAAAAAAVEAADEDAQHSDNELARDRAESEHDGATLYDASSPASPSTASPMEPQESLVDTLQGELHRAEEMIRQMSVSQAERDAHIAKLVAEQERERASMRAAAEAAAAAARQEAEKAVAAASPVKTSTMRLNRDEPYLLNMDGAGDWVVAHLAPVQTRVGVARASCTVHGKLQRILSTPHGKDHRSGDGAATPSGCAASYDSSLSLSATSSHPSNIAGEEEVQDGGGSDGDVDSSSSDVRYVTLPPEFSDGVGAPHCVLERTTAADPPTGVTSSKVVLRGCGNSETYVLRPLCPEPLAVRGEGDSLVLQSGDVLDIGTEHIQLKYMDPSAPPLTARGRRTVPLSVGSPLPATMSTLSVSPGSHERLPVMRVVPTLDSPVKGEGTRSWDENGRADESSTSSRRMTTSSERGEANTDADDGSEHHPDSNDSPMKSPAEQPGRAVEMPLRPLIPTLALGRALPTIYTPPHQQEQHADPSVGGAVDHTNSTTSTTERDEDRRTSSSMPSSEWTSSNADLHSANPEHFNLDKQLNLCEAAAVATDSATKFKSRKPSKRAEADTTASAGVAPHATLTSSELQSMRANATSSSYRSELPANFVGRYNFVLIGPSGGGKTSLVHNLATPDKPWLQSAFSAFTGGSRDGSAVAGVHPTIGIKSRTITSVGSCQVSLVTHELGGTPCFSPLLDLLPSHRVTYLLCFPLHGLTSLMTLRGVVEDILCRTDSHTVSLVLVGTHADRNAAGKEEGSFFSRLPTARQEMLRHQLEEVEQQVVSLIQMLQPYPQLRPTVVGRFAIDNVHRHIYSTGYQVVEGFPQWLQWLADFARDRCRADADFANGLIPARCLELGRQVSLLRQHGKWCVSLRDFKALAAAVSSQYKTEAGGSAAGQPPRTALHLAPAVVARDALRNHVQLLADWGVLMHRYRSLPLRQHIILDVLWLSRLLAALACCPLIAAAESNGFSKEEVATLVGIVGEEGTMSLTRKEAALRTLLTPEAEQVVDAVRVATTDTPHLLRCGVLSIPVLIAMLELHFRRCESAAVTAAGGGGHPGRIVVGRMIDNSNVQRRQQQPLSLSLEGPSTGGSTVTRYAVPLAGVVELLVLLDLVIMGSKLAFSPPCVTGQSRSSLSPSTSPPLSSISAVHRSAGASASRGETTAAEGDIDDVENESFVLYPLSFRTPASAGVTWLFPCFLSGPFYVFKLDMVPRNFFPKLMCRLATVADHVYLGPVEEKLWGSATQHWAYDPSRPRPNTAKCGGSSSSHVNLSTSTTSPTTSGAAVAAATVAGPFDSYFERRAGLPFVLPSFSSYLASTTADGQLRRRDGFWFDAAWLAYDSNDDCGGVDRRAGAKDRCRVLVRLVHHSVFLSFHCHSVAAADDAAIPSSSSHAAGAWGGGGGRASPGVQDFYEAVLEAVRYVVEEFPGGKCVESMQCCVDSATLLQVEQQHPAMLTDHEAAEQDRYLRFASISDNINNLERVLSKSGAALRTARTARRPNTLTPAGLTHPSDGAVEDESAYVPLLRCFSETPPLSIYDCIRRWKSEQRLYIAPDVEAHLTAALHDLEECYHADAPAAASSDSCAKLDALLDVLARVDTI